MLEQGPWLFRSWPSCAVVRNFDPQLFEILQQQDTLSMPERGADAPLAIRPGAAPGACWGWRRQRTTYGAVGGIRPTWNFRKKKFGFSLPCLVETACGDQRCTPPNRAPADGGCAIYAGEPVLVTDEKACLLLSTRRLFEVPGLMLLIEGHPIRSGGSKRPGGSADNADDRADIIA